ncbi:MAG: hypothetical protein EPO11_00455 [Gammaproteobacteria bacterium]|nr:MAG: hypothetical protein EPO11_00455 [Gammaproteobacteria bacterium]
MMDNTIVFEKEFTAFQKKYGEILKKYLTDETASEALLHEGYKLGREAVADKLGILTVTAIHHDRLINFLENLKANGHLMIAEKASLFLEEVLAPFQMIGNGFHHAIKLLNQRSVEFAVRIRDLQHSLAEKEALLKEVYHRVKNNLQVMSSLLHLQIETTHDNLAKKVLTESERRIRAMSLVHEMLYQSQNLSQIEMQEYIHTLLKYLYEIYNVDRKKIQRTTDIDAISLEIDTAIPLGLIINELVSNTLKYAFPDDKTGTLSLSLKKEHRKIILIIHDDGIGIPPDVDVHTMVSLGMQLIFNLARQLHGKIGLNRDKGTTFTVTIPIK